jgi:hypothetical protein
VKIKNVQIASAFLAAKLLEYFLGSKVLLPEAADEFFENARFRNKCFAAINEIFAVQMKSPYLQVPSVLELNIEAYMRLCFGPLDRWLSLDEAEYAPLLNEDVVDMLKDMNPRQSSVLIALHGLDGSQASSQAEIARKFDISPTTVVSREREAIAELAQRIKRSHQKYVTDAKASELGGTSVSVLALSREISNTLFSHRVYTLERLKEDSYLFPLYEVSILASIAIWEEMQ